MEVANESEVYQEDSHSPQEEMQSILAMLTKLEWYELEKAGGLGSRLGRVVPLNMMLTLARSKHLAQRMAGIEAMSASDLELNDSAVELLCCAIDDRSNRIALAAIRALGNKRVSGVEDDLVSCLTMENTRIAGAALLSLAKIGTTDVTELVAEFLESGDAAKIKAASRVIALLKLEAFAAAMLRIVEEIRGQAEVKEESNPYLYALHGLVSALATIQYEPATPVLSDLAVNHVGTRSRSIQALQQMGQPYEELLLEAYNRHPTGKIRRLMVNLGYAPEEEDQN